MSGLSAANDGSASLSTERTPLLQSSTSNTDSPTAAAPPIATKNDLIAPPCNIAQHEDGHTGPNQSIGLVRGLLCTLALGFLVFLQATNISMLTTTQSNIASEFDAFERATWFTSAYLIAMSALGPLNGKLASLFSPRICIFA